VDFAANAASLGAHAIRAQTRDQLLEALKQAKHQKKTTVIVVEVDPKQRVGGYESWWDVAVAEVSDMPSVQQARREYEKNLSKERYFL